MERVMKPDYNENIRKVVIMSPLLILCLVVCCSGCHYINGMLGWKDDHPLEQLTEAAIKAEYGVDVDLTP